MANLTTKICGLEFSNPIMTAAGPGAKDGDLCIAAVKGGAGGLVTKTISEFSANVPRPCMAKTNSGFLNTELWSELPIEQWLKSEYKKAKSTGVPVIVGMGYTAEQIREIAPKIKPFADAVELSTHYVGTDVSPIVNALKAAKEILNVPVFMKMSPHTDIKEIAKAVEKAGADGLVMINSFGPCMAIDVETGYPIMGSKTGYGWLSGAPIRPLAVRCIYDVAQVVNIPIIGVGGITNGRDAVEMIMAGASAVQICTEAILKGPNIYGKVAKELNEFLDNKNLNSILDIKGLTIRKAKERSFRAYSIAPKIDANLCSECGLCAKSCVYEAINFNNGINIDEEKCFGCGLCVTKCPKHALSINYK